MERRFCLLWLGLCLLPGLAHASDDSSGFYWPIWLQLGGQLRGRFEDLSAPALAGTGKDDFLYLSRLRFNLGVKARPWLRFFAQVQDSRVFGYDGVAPASMSNPIDLRQAYVEVGDEGQNSIRARVGRQEIALGSQRLVGISDFGNVTRTFDGARLAIHESGIAIDLLAASVVLIDPSRFDRHKPGEHLYGSYLALSKLLRGASVEPYAFVKHTLNVVSEKGMAGDALTLTMGARVIGKTDFNFDYSAEIAAQRGSYSIDRVSALAGVYTLGWTLARAAWTPRFSVAYKHASGDRANQDGVRQTFDQLYSNLHGFAGIVDQVGWKNISNPRASFEVNITKKLRFQHDFNDFFLATVQDGLYNSAGIQTILNRAANSNHVGWEADLSAFYVQSKHAQFGAGFGHLFAGKYLRESTSRQGYNYPYIMWLVDF